MTQLSFSLPPPSSTEPGLQTEMGWGEVAAGLNRILFGNLVLIFMPLFGILLIVVALTQGGDPMSLVETEKFRKGGYETFFLFLGGLLTIAASGFIGYPLILFGRIRCLVNVPERCGAKWLMFVCVLALVAGPALGILASILGAGRDGVEMQKTVKKGSAVRKAEDALPQLLGEKFYLKSYFWLNVGSFAISMTSEVCFLLFLRAVANCFNSTMRVAMVDFYFVLLAGILVLSGYLLFGGPAPPVALVLLLCIAVGLIASGIWYLVLLISTASCIMEGIEPVREEIPPQFGAPH